MEEMYTIALTGEELELISVICHEYKDIYRGSAENIRPVMYLEKTLAKQTKGVYEPDTTYDLR